MPRTERMNKGVRALGCGLLLLPLGLMAGDVLSRVPTGIGRPMDVCAEQSLGLVKSRVAQLDEAGASLRRLQSQPVPKGLGYEETREAHRYALWLREVSDRIGRLGRKGEQILNYCGRSGAGDAGLAKAQMQEMQSSFHAQYLQLQNSLYQEHRQFSVLSNIMKKRHDSATDAIRNIR
jgi:hypothetical protein